MRRSTSIAPTRRAPSIPTTSEIHTTKRFREAFAALPPQVQAQARLAYQLFRQDPHHPSLRFKQVHASRPIYSARVG